MKKLKCKKCGQEIEGYSSTHVEYLMWQHDLKHRREEENKKEANEK